MRAGNVGFFTLLELSEIVSEFNKYAYYVQQFHETKLRNEKKRIYDDVMSRTYPDVQRLICASLRPSEIHAIQLSHIVEQSLDSLLERKQLMYRNIAHILAAKARNIVSKHSGFKSTFCYTHSDDERLEHYFFERTTREIDYLELRPIIRIMHNRAQAIKREQEYRADQRGRCHECGARGHCRCDEPEPECEWCGDYCNGHCSGARKYERRLQELRDEEEEREEYRNRYFFF